MKIGVLGTGMVGQTVGGKLVSLGHEVKLGSRDANNEKAAAWAKGAGSHASHGTFADAAAFGELLVNCTAGAGSLDALRAAGEANIGSKILMDLANPLDFSKGMPPSLFVTNTESLGERIQAALPKARVVKTLNTVNCNLMVDAARVGGGDHDMFVCGNDADAKAHVTELLRGWFGWKRVTDLGDITAARATEAYLHLWLRLYGAFKSADFNVRVVK